MEDERRCKMCFNGASHVDPLIRACGCTAAAVHRDCLDQWRAVSPHADSMTTCEVCQTQYKLIIIPESGCGICYRYTRYTLAVTMDLLFFFSIFAAVYIFCGWVGDKALTEFVRSLICVPTTWDSCEDQPMEFLWQSSWRGSIWFWGFVVLFFFIGIVGCCVCAFCKPESSYDGDRTSYGHSDCWWIWCGPSYYHGSYYSPYGYWGPGDTLCLWCMLPHYHYAPSTYMGSCHGCAGGGCSGLGGNQNCGKDAAMVLIIIVIIIVAIFVIIGVILGSIMLFLLVNKITKRHLTLLQRRAEAKQSMVADQDDPEEMSRVSEGLFVGVTVNTEKDELLFKGDIVTK